MTTKKSLLLFTHMYPFGEGENFLEEEVHHLANYFSKIIIIPNELGPLHRPLPPSVRVETEFAEAIHNRPLKKIYKRLSAALSSGYTYKEIMDNPSLLFSPSRLRIFLYFVSQSEFYYTWLKSYLKRHPSLKNALFYSYWLHIQSHGISLLKKRDFPKLTQISRAHSYEIYLEDYPPCYHPFRREHLPSIDKIYTISEHGKQRLLNDHAPLIRSISTSRLGVKDPGFLNPINETDTLSLASVASLIPLKRINLCIKALEQLASAYPTKKISWHHIGDGPLDKELQSEAKNRLRNRIQWKFHGRVTSEQLYEFYRNTPIDLLINTSSTEGIPVSIMEALSCGIPILATDVGGVAEIVNEKVGRLLPGDPSPAMIAASIAELTCDGIQRKTIREEARKHWNDNYRADDNFDAFAKAISKEPLE